MKTYSMKRDEIEKDWLVVDADDVAPGLLHGWVELRVAGAEVNRGRVLRELVEDRLRVRQHVAAVVGDREAADPTVEELHRLAESAGAHLSGSLTQRRENDRHSRPAQTEPVHDR